MSITPDQIIMASDAVYRGSAPVDDGGCEYVLRFMVPTRRDVESIESHIRANGNFATVQLIALSSDGDAPEVPASRYERDAQALRESGWLSRTDVLATLGTDDEYHQWVTYQPSIVSGAYNETDDCGDQRNVACHVLRADAVPARSGDHPNKPAFVQIPMTNDEHHRQHNHGEMAVFIRWQRMQGIAPLVMDRDAAQRWFDQRLLEHRMRWAELMLCDWLRVDSLNDVDPLTIVQFARDNALPVPDYDALNETEHRS